MKQFTKASLRSLLALTFVCACAVGVARADVRNLRVISARAGGVNLVSGDVKVRRATSADWVALSTPDELKSGDTVRTGSNGRVEVLLNPGSYLRAGGNTEFTLAETDLDKLRVEFSHGSAVVEATGYRDMGLFIDVVVPGAIVKILTTGVYRINVPASGPTEVSVTKGRAFVGITRVKSGKVARVSNGNVEVVKLDKNWRDELDQWSKERGKELARANSRVNRRELSNALGSYQHIFGFNNYYDAFGFWFYNTGYGCYTFFPFGYGWRSPYGYNYGMGVYYRPFRDAPWGWVPSTNQPPGGGTASNPGGGGTWGGGSNPGGGGSNPGGGGNNNPGGGRDFTPMTPTPITPPSRVEPTERPMRERTIEPGSRP